MAGASKKEKAVEVSPLAKLTHDLLVEIISRVPYKSTCCCKCLSVRWRDLISHPDYYKKMPQSIAGFFYEVYNRHCSRVTARNFTNVSGKGGPLVDPSLSFLPKYESLEIWDCCNGLLLCRCCKATDPETLEYIVCNPATEKWVVVPATDWSSDLEVARLGFDLAVSSHFHVFEFVDQCLDGPIEKLSVYSSKAGAWTVNEKIADDNRSFAIPWNARSVFLNGVLHLACFDDCVVAVDVEGKLLWIIDIPMRPLLCNVFINDVFPSERRLYFANSTAGILGSELSVWVLEDCHGGKWTLKHNVSNSKLFGAKYSSFEKHYNVMSFHPERNMIFIVCGKETTIMSYDMDSMELCFICQLGSDCQGEGYAWDKKTPFFSYVPIFSESLLANGH